MTNKTNHQNGQRRNRVRDWAAIVATFGAALGVLSRNFALGIALGVLFGVVISILIGREE